MLVQVLGEILVGPLAAVRVSVDTPIGGEEHIGVILARAAAHADLLVVGSHGYGHILSGVRAGSVTSTCLHEAACPVVVIPESREDERNGVRNAKLAMEQRPYPTLYPPGQYFERCGFGQCGCASPSAEYASPDRSRGA